MTDHSHGDFETRSAVDLAKCGVHVYASDDSTAPWCFAWAIGAEPVELWTPDQPGNIQRLFDYIAAGGLFYAWNAAFELAIWNRLMTRRYGWPELPIEQTRCVMAMSYAMALPGSLDAAASAVGLDIGKDLEGKKLMMQLARPRKIIRLDQRACRYCLGFDHYNPFEASAVCKHCGGSGKVPGASTEYVWWDTPEKLERLGAYCRQDVEVERRMAAILLPLSADEQDVWTLDQQINNRGIQLDLQAIDAAMGVVASAKERLDKRMAFVTAGAVKTCSQVQALKDWLAVRGVEADGLAKADVLELLARPDLSEPVRSAILLRQEAAKSSTAKLKAMRLCVNDDGRARGLHQYWGANTGRWSGRRIQVQNFPRSTMYQEDIDEVLEVLSRG